MYELTLRKQNTLNGRQLKNIAGKVVLFEDGVALVEDEYIYEAAKRYRYIASRRSIEPESSPVETEPEIAPVEPETVAAPETVPEAEAEAETELEVEAVVEAETEPEVAETPEPEAVETPEEVEDTPDVARLYEELGTWTAVAERLEISTAALRKLREEQGLI